MSIEESPSMQPPERHMMGQEQMQPAGGQGQEPQAQTMQAPQGHMVQGGHLYIQTNEIQNCIIHYYRAPDGTLTEAGRILTGGAGTGGYKPISGEPSAANDFEGAKSVILTPDRRFLFTTNGGDNSVSSFAVSEDGKLTLLDAKRTGNIVAGRNGRGAVLSGTAKALQYSPSHKMLYVLHSFGNPDHLRLMSVDDEGNLTPRPEGYTVNTPDKPNRIATMAALTADEKYLVVGTTFDEPPTFNPDGSPILWQEKNGEPYVIASNAPDPDGTIVFPLDAHGTLGQAKFQDGGGGSPWYYLFLRHRPDTFVVGYAVGDGVALGKIDEDGNISVGPITQVNTFRGKPTEICWVSATPDDRLVFSTAFGYGYLTSYRIDGNVITIAKDPACPQVPGDGKWHGALNGTISSGPSDSWICPTGSFLYQIYGNASKLIGYAIQPDGGLEEITSATIPYNSPQGLTGF